MCHRGAAKRGAFQKKIDDEEEEEEEGERERERKCSSSQMKN